MDFLSGSVVKNLPANAEDTRDRGSTPGLGRSPGEGIGNPLQYSCLENSMKFWDTQVGIWDTQLIKCYIESSFYRTSYKKHSDFWLKESF